MMLSTIAKLKAHLGIPAADTSKDAKLTTILSGASTYIEGQTARKFAAQVHRLKLSGDGSDELVLPQYPIVNAGTDADPDPAITTLKLDGVDILAEIAAGTIEVDLEAGILYRENDWREDKRNIEIVYSAGFSLPSDESGESGVSAGNVPEDLEMAVLRLAARIYERSTAEGVQSVSAGSFSTTYKDAVDEDIKQTIARHSRLRVG